MAAAQSEAEAVFENLIDDDKTAKKVAVSDVDPKSYMETEGWLTMFQVDDVEDPLPAVSQIYKDKLMESSRTSKYQ